MRKKSLLIILLIGGFILSLNKVKANNLSYQIGEQIEVRLNSNEKATFYVVENSDSNTEDVRAIYSGVLGDNIKLAEGMKKDECQFEKSNIYQELMNKTSSWTNIKEVTLPTGSQALGQDFDETELQNFRNISSNYEGDTTHFKLTGISTVPFYALDTNHTYWLSSITHTPSDIVTDQSKLDKYPCMIYQYGQYLLQSGSYLMVAFEGLSAKIKPMIVVSKSHIIVPDKTTSIPTSPQRGSQTVKVANTAASTTILVFVIGLLLLGIGIFIIYKTFSKNKNEKRI